MSVAAFLPTGSWSSLALLNAFIIGMYVAGIAGFVRWRLGKKVVTTEFWRRMVDGYVELERSVRKLSVSQNDSHGAYRAVSDRLELSMQENHALQMRLQSLESHLDSVTDEATTLVSGLRDNEQRWAEAEAVRTELQDALEQAHRELAEATDSAGSLSVANTELSRRLEQSGAELHRAHAVIAQLQDELARRSHLEAHLNQALDRDRRQVATLSRLEDRYRTTHHQLMEATRRASSLEQRLRASAAPAALTPPAPPPRGNGVFDLHEPGSIDLRSEASAPNPIDLRPAPPRAQSAAALSHTHGHLPD